VIVFRHVLRPVTMSLVFYAFVFVFDNPYPPRPTPRALRYTTAMHRRN